MKRFHIVDDGVVILRSKGVFRQAKLFVRDGYFYAGHGGGFVKLMSGNGTSVPAISWLEMDAPGYTVRFDYLAAPVGTALT